MVHTHLHHSRGGKGSTDLLTQSDQDWAYVVFGMGCVGGDIQYSAGMFEQCPISDGVLLWAGGCVGLLGPIEHDAGATLGAGGLRLGCGCTAAAAAHYGAASDGAESRWAGGCVGDAERSCAGGGGGGAD